MTREQPVPMPPAATAVLAKLASWLMPLFIGAVLMQLVEASGERALAAQNQREIRELRQELNAVETSLAAGGPPALARRVDDLQAQVNAEFNKIHTKLDNIQALLMNRP